MSAYIRVYIVIYGGIYRPHRGSNKVVIGYVYAYIYLITAPIYGYVCVYIYPITAPLLPLYIAIYTRIYTPLLPHYCPHIWPYMRAYILY